MPTALSSKPVARNDARDVAALRPSTSRALALAWTFASLSAVTALKVACFDYIGESTPFLLYVIVIIGAAWYGGWAGGLGATVLSAALGTYFFIPPLFSPHVADLAAAIRCGVFVLEGTVITAIMNRLSAAGAQIRAAALEARSATAKLEGVLRGVSDGITVQTAAGQLIYANSAAAELTGFASSDALLAASVPEIMSRFEMLTPAGDPFPTAELPGRLVLAGLPPSERLIRFRVRATGDERWAAVRANAVRIGDSDVPYAVNVFQDVTESRKRDDELRVSREWFSTTLRSIGDAVIATDSGGRVTFLNPIAERLTGWDFATAQGRPLAEVFHIVNEHTRAPVASPVDKVIGEGTVVGLANHTVLIARHGIEFSIEDSAAPIRAPDGQSAGAVLVFRDVSDKRAEERRGTFIARAVAELASSLDYKQTLSTVAKLAVPTIADWCAVDIRYEGRLHRLEVAHVDPEKIRLVYDIESRYPADPQSAGGAYEVLRTGKPIFVGEIADAMLAGVAKDAEHLRMLRQLQLRSYIAVPLIDGQVAPGNGATKGTAGVVPETPRVMGVITMAVADSNRVYTEPDLALAVALADRAALAVKQAQLYSEANQARADAEDANRAKDEFLAMLGHELRNPLAPMMTALELIRLRAPEMVERERAVLDRQVKHLVRLVDDLLDVSRITRNAIALAKSKVALAEALDRALELAGPLIEERRHTVTVKLPEDVHVVGDPVRLAQVFCNLLTNAAKYTQAGGRIDVTGERQGKEIVIRVRDNGVGIAPDILPRVFDLFVQAGQSIDRAMGGLGLGLTIVRSVIEMHGGRVSASSAGLGCGSEFVVWLPTLEDASAASTSGAAPAPSVPVPVPMPGTAPPPATAASIVRSSHRNVDVLVVDDNIDALELLGEALQLIGYRTHMAPDPAAALSMAAVVKPAIALLDIGLPVMDGYELARQLRATPELAAVKLVAITGYGQASDKARAHAAGFDDHLVKPITVDAVERVLRKLLGRASDA